jgi:hypothetical protein
MARIALATASDGRDFVHQEVGPFGLDVQDRLAAALRERGHEVLTGAGDLSSNTEAVRLSRAGNRLLHNFRVAHDCQ